MYAQIEKSKGNKRRSNAKSIVQKQKTVMQKFGFVDYGEVTKILYDKRPKRGGGTIHRSKMPGLLQKRLTKCTW